ncbi:MAG TPA: PAS domain-containing protein, partial [Chryseolinea sp.]
MEIDPQIVSSIFELSSEVVWVLQGGDRICYASQVQKIKFDIPEKIDADFWASGIHPDDRGRIVLEFNKSLKDRKVFLFELEYRFKSPSGLYYHLLDKLKFVRNKAGKAITVISVWKDITDVVNKQVKLENTHTAMELDRSRFKLISEMSNAAMWELDFETGKMTWFAGSNTLEEFGLNKDNYSVSDWKESIHPDDSERVLRY